MSLFMVKVYLKTSHANMLACFQWALINDINITRKFARICQIDLSLVIKNEKNRHPDTTSAVLEITLETKFNKKDRFQFQNYHR